jgi:putative tricarboxylic transport membrane protein
VNANVAGASNVVLTKDRIAAVVIFLFSAAVFVYSQNTLAPSVRPFPSAIAGIMAVLSIAMFATTYIKSLPQPDDKPFFRNPLNFVITIASIAGYFFLLSKIGYFSATFVMVIGLSLLLGYRRYGLIALTAVGFLAFIYAVFVVIFERPLPPEFFFDH